MAWKYRSSCGCCSSLHDANLRSATGHFYVVSGQKPTCENPAAPFGCLLGGEHEMELGLILKLPVLLRGWCVRVLDSES